MSQIQPYINLHAHSAPGSNEVSVRNVFLQDFFINDQLEEQFVSVGFHPWHIGKNSNSIQIKAGLEIAAGSGHVIAIGETGLDKSIDFAIERQEEVFKAHIEVSEMHNKPLIIHCVRAFQEILSLRKEIQPSQTWVFHGFNGSAQLAKQIIATGCLVSYGKAILKENTRAVHSLLHLEPGQFFLETDDADLPISEIYAMAAIIKQIPLWELTNTLHRSFFKVFGK